MDYENVFRQSLEYFKGDTLAAAVFAKKYALTDNDGDILEATPDDMHRRMAKEFARIEEKYPNPLTSDEIYQLFRNFGFVVPQGSPMAGIGNPYQIQSLSNCFVIDSPADSYGGILKTDQELVQIAKRRGGIGFDISTIRPKGLTTANAARTTDGIEVFMDRYSNSCREVAQGGRRGALMLTISVHHPQIRDFIRIKRELTRVTGANISIRLTDEFLNAVSAEQQFELRFPVDIDADHIISEMIDASSLWHDIIESAHTCAEPGLLFWDNVKRNSPADIYADEGFATTSTNPCGEIVLSPYDSCRLMLINLRSLVRDPYTAAAAFDFEKMAEVVQKAQRLMDDLIDLEIEQINKIIAKIESDPEVVPIKRIELDLWSNIRDRAVKGRRTGLGVSAVGDTLAALGVKYGSDKSIRIVESIYRCLAINAYRSSCIMARERGAFPVHDHTKEVDHPFLRRIWEVAPDIEEMSEVHGRRNIALTTTAPAGSVSTLTQTTSGIEPAYLLKYTRRRKVTDDESFDFVDDVGDRWKEYEVNHPGFQAWMNITGKTAVEDSPYYGACSNDIDWVQKVNVQAAAQRWICHAISNTTNIPEDTDIETVKKIYTTAWKMGCKGVTVYRENCRSGVLVKTKFRQHHAPQRSPVLSCHIHHATIKGEAWTILVGLMEDRPYEIIGGLSSFVEIPRKYRNGNLTKNPRKTMNSKYDLTFGEDGNEIILKDVVALFDNPNYSAFTRIISLGLRHGAPIQYVVEQLQKDKDADLFSFSKVVARVLKNYIENGTKANGFKACPECSSESAFIYVEGCVTCSACGWSKCG